MHGLVRPDRQASGSAVNSTLSDHEATENAQTAADMVGNLVAKVATRCRAEPGDLYAAKRMERSDGRPTPGSACR